MAFKKGKGVGTLARMNGKDRERERERERGEGGGGRESLLVAKHNNIGPSLHPRERFLGVVPTQILRIHTGPHPLPTTPSPKVPLLFTPHPHTCLRAPRT